MRRKSFYIYLLVILAFFLLSPSLCSKAQLSVSPLSMILEAPPGELATADLNLRNTGQEEVQVNIQLVDWWRNPKGSLQFLPPGERGRSCAEWLLYSPTSLTIEPGESEQISVEVEVPKEKQGDHWAMLLVTQQSAPEETEQQVTTEFTVNYAVKVLQKDPRVSRKDAKITDIEMTENNPLELSVTYENTGIKHVQTTGRVEIRNLQGDTVKEFEIDEFPTLPGEKHIINVAWEEAADGLEPGQYYAIAIMDFGADHLVQGGLPIEIPEGEEESD